MTHYYAKNPDAAEKHVACGCTPGESQGVQLVVGGLAIQRLRPDGTLLRYRLDPTAAAELGLQLDSEGTVVCV